MRAAVRPLLVLLAAAAPGSAQDAVRLAEDFAPGHAYRIDATVKVTGRLAVPLQKDKPPRVVEMAGTSRLIYDERVLPPDDAGTLKTVRAYREVDFRRRVGDADQDATVRPAVRRMVVLKGGAKKAPFSPDGPLTWGEIDLIRTDIFTPAAVPGLLPAGPVRPGQSWPVAPAAVAELTDMEKVDAGGLTAEYVGPTTVDGKRLARLKVSGTVRGVNEDGPNTQTLDGTLYFDLDAHFLTYLSLKGTHELLDGQNRVVGRIEGQFTMTRTPVAPSAAPAMLSDAALQGLELRPTGENTLLLYDNTDLGVRLLHPRTWRVGAVQGRQVTVDHARSGSGVLVTLEAASKVPTADDYLREISDYLRKEQAKDARLAERVTRVRAAPATLDRFAVEAEMSGERVRLEYAVLKQPDGGATVAARLPAGERIPPAVLAELRADVDRLTRTLAVTKAIPAK